MCGRYSFAVEDELIKERFGVSVRSAVWKARYNCAPTQDLAVISTSDPLTLSMYRWGLIPPWAKSRGTTAAMINARAETILAKPSFKTPFRHRRCLVPADGFYEWKKTVKGKAPHRFILKGGAPFSMAGIWDQWVSPDGEIIRSFAILTTTPNELMKEIHDRMPVILPREHEITWLENTPEQDLLRLLVPYPAQEMEAYPVSREVNKTWIDAPDLISRL